MILQEPYYHGIFRKVVIAFGQLFTGVTIVRQKDGKKVQKIAVPVAYGPKEKWLRRIEENPDGKKNISAELPRISFEITGYRYDSSRKAGSNPTMFKSPDVNKVVSTPIPYNVQLNMYIIARTQEDSLQIVEQILPYFAPGLTVQIKAVDDPEIYQDIPFSLDNVIISDSWEGDFDSPRFVIHELSFTAKVYLFGPVESAKIIKRVKANISNTSDMTNRLTNYNAELNPFATELKTEPHTIDEFWYEPASTE